jgi:lactoylglutathione lyase
VALEAGAASLGTRDRGAMSDRAFPIISVRDLPAVRTFYERLGFVQTFQYPPDGEPGFVTVERGPSSIGIGAGAADDHVALWVYVDNVDATLEQLQAAGAPIIAEPEDQPWGERVAQTRDPDGTLVYLGAPS